MEKIKNNWLIRELMKRQLTGNLGKVIEKDDRLICYVDKYKYEKDVFANTFSCSGITDGNRQLAETYNLNKPIYYVFDGLKLDKHKVCIFGYDEVNVIIRNCQFSPGLCVRVHGKCFLLGDLYTSELSIYADDITIRNVNTINESKYYNDFNVDIGADNNLHIINSNIGEIGKNENISISAGKKMIIDDSKIAGNMIICESPKIVTHYGTSLIADKIVNLNTKDFESIEIMSPVVLFNGNRIAIDNKVIKLNQLTNSLLLKRQELITLLKQVKDICDKVNSNDINEYKTYVNNRSISKTLKLK